MPFCPTCGAAYRAGDECRTCGVSLGETPPESLPGAGRIDWFTIYKGEGIRLRSLEESLRRQGFDVIRLPEHPRAYPEMPVHTWPDLRSHRVAIPADQYHSRREEVETVLASVRANVEDPEAMREAEEDFDVRACPECLLFFHENYSTCPECEAALVPAVECFEEGQAEPDRVIVGHGSEAQVKSLEASLKAQGFDAQAFEVEGWTVDVVDLPWGELIDRTAEVESILGIRNG